MTIRIHRFLKSDLSEVTNHVVSMANTTGMTISHFACSDKSYGSDITFTIEGVEKHIPIIGDDEFCVVVRKKVNMVATGPNEQTIEGIGPDVGKYEYVDKVPPRTLDLPPGFQELYKNK